MYDLAGVEISALLRRRANEAKLAAHGIGWEEVEEVVRVNRWVPSAHPDYPDQVRVIGPTRRGRLLTIVLQETGDEAVWRPVTGWPSEDGEIAYYREETQ